MRILLLAPLIFLGIGCGTLHTQVYLFDEQGFREYKYVKTNLHVLAAMKDPKAQQLYKEMRAFVAYTESNNALTTFSEGVWHQGNLVTPSAAAEEVRSFIGPANAPTKPEAASASKKAVSSSAASSVTSTQSPPTKALLNSSLALKSPERLYAPARFWRQQTNTATAFGAYGDVDIAIRMDANADYSIKGFRIDSAKLIANTVALTREVVATVAASYGVPSPLSSNVNGKSSAFSVTDDLQAVADRVADQRLQISKRQMAENYLLQFISSEESQLEDPKQLSAAIANIQKEFDRIKADLNSDPNQQTASEQPSVPTPTSKPAESSKSSATPADAPSQTPKPEKTSPSGNATH